jgi:hypothetical protein
MRRAVKLLGLAAAAVFFVFAATLLFPLVVSPKRSLTVAAVAPNAKVTYCELTVTTNRPTVYFSRGHRVSRSYFEREALVFQYLSRFLKLSPVHVYCEGATNRYPFLVLTVALRMPDKQLAETLRFSITDAAGTRINDVEQGGSKTIKSRGGTIVLNCIPGAALGMKRPLDITVNDENGVMLAHLISR